MEAAGHDVDVFRHLSATFLEIAPPMFERLRHAIEQRKATAVTLESHSLKGTVALVGGEQAVLMLARIEALSRSGAMDEIALMLPTLSDLYAAVEGEVRSSITHSHDTK
jgi:hypothetical protein